MIIRVNQIMIKSEISSLLSTESN